MTMRMLRLSTLVMLCLLAGCATRRPSAALPPPPPPAPSVDQRALVETPPPATVPEPPLPALKPGTELTLAQTEALADQASPKGPPVERETTPTPGQKAMGRMAATGSSGPAGAPAVAPVSDAAHLVGLSQTDAEKMFGLPAESKELPPSRIWTYHSPVCDVKLFFYPEVGGPAYRALTYQIDERGAADATHNACLSSLAKSHAG
ncbi:MAG TPA: hypothetical protein VIE35_06810 [Dongiaceae bacterium]